MPSKYRSIKGIWRNTEPRISYPKLSTAKTIQCLRFVLRVFARWCHQIIHTKNSLITNNDISFRMQKQAIYETNMLMHRIMQCVAVSQSHMLPYISNYLNVIVNKSNSCNESQIIQIHRTGKLAHARARSTKTQEKTEQLDDYIKLKLWRTIFSFMQNL